jgi:hypothetical protein
MNQVLAWTAFAFAVARRIRGLARRRAKAVVLAFAALAAGLGPSVSIAQADSERIRELERKLEQSLKTINELADRVRELENRSPAQAETQAAPAPGSGTHSQPGTVSSIVESVMEKAPTTLRGFADIGWGRSGNGGNKGFKDAAMSFYLTPRLSESVKSVVELVFERDATGALSADLERLQVGYSFRSGTTVWLGRFHTPLGYWNTAFHHGQQLQTSVLRPQMIDFEDHGGVLPVHTVGVWGTGAVNAGTGKVSYDLYGGNAPSIKGNALNPNDLGRVERGGAAGFNLGYLFGGSADGLKIGTHGYRGDVRDDSSPVNRIRLNILGGYAALDSPLWEAIGEYYHFSNNNLAGGSGTFSSWAGFAQLGRRFDLWTPYGRVERASLNQQDSYFALQTSGRSYRRAAVGLRYDVTPDSAIKAELNRTSREDSPTVNFNQLLLQWAIRF